MNSAIISETRKFASDVVWVAISQVLVSLISVIVLPALTKSYTPEIYGVWVQAGVTVGLLTPVLTLHLGSAAVRFLAGVEDREKRRRAFGTMLWPVVTLSCLALLTSVLARRGLSTFLFAAPQYVSFIPLTFLWALMEALFILSTSYLRARGKIMRLSVIQIAFSVGKIALIVLLATADYGLGWVIASVIAMETLFIAVVFTMIIGEIGLPKPSLIGLWSFLAFSVPQIPSGILLWVMSGSDRYFITHLLDLPQAGIYSVSYSLGSIVSLLFSPISFVLFPTVSKFWEQKEISRVRSYLEYSTRLFLALAIPGAVGLYVLSQPLLGILATSEYMVGGLLVLLVAVGTILLGIYQINVYIILLVQQVKWLPLMIGVAAAINAGINIALIPRMGITASAVAAIASYFVLAAIVTVWARRAISYRIGFRFLSKVLVASLIMLFCLRFIEIGSALMIILAVFAGAGIFVLALWLLRAFSIEDRRFARQVLSGLNPVLWREEFASRRYPSSSPQIPADPREREENSRKGNINGHS